MRIVSICGAGCGVDQEGTAGAPAAAESALLHHVLQKMRSGFEYKHAQGLALVAFHVVLEKKSISTVWGDDGRDRVLIICICNPKIWSPSDKSFLVNQWVTLDNSTAAL
jgi:hypothetical protein